MDEKKEVRSDYREVNAKGKRGIEGAGIVFNSKTKISWFYESILPEAVSDALLKSDIRALFNHDSNWVLGRVPAGTLELRKTPQGVYYYFDAPDTQAGNDVLVNVGLRNVTGSSFSFAIAKGGDRWEDLPGGLTLRTVTKIEKIWDLGPVVFPAYEDTTAALRSYEDWQRRNGKQPADWRDDIRRREIQLKQIQLEMNRPQPHRTTLAEAEQKLKALRH